MTLLSDQRDKLIANGWRESDNPFWLEEPCFYDLSKMKTVLLFRNSDGRSSEDHYFWKYEWQVLPEFLDADNIELRRYKLHHSMNALLWHDYGDRKIVH